MALCLSPGVSGVNSPHGHPQPLQARASARLLCKEGLFQLQLLLFFPRCGLLGLPLCFPHEVGAGRCNDSEIPNSCNDYSISRIDKVRVKSLQGLCSLLVPVPVVWVTMSSSKNTSLRPPLLRDSSCNLIWQISWQCFSWPSGWLFSTSRVHQPDPLETILLHGSD